MKNNLTRSKYYGLSLSLVGRLVKTSLTNNAGYQKARGRQNGGLKVPFNQCKNPRTTIHTRLATFLTTSRTRARRLSRSRGIDYSVRMQSQSPASWVAVSLAGSSSRSTTPDWGRKVSRGRCHRRRVATHRTVRCAGILPASRSNSHRSGRARSSHSNPAFPI